MNEPQPTAPPEPKTWTTTGLLDYFVKIHETMEDRSFAFVLGSGASVGSKIPTGGQLVQLWLKELHRRLDPQHEHRSLNEWATADNLRIDKFEYERAAEFYPHVFARRFEDDPEEGYAELEAIMKGKEPSFGYSVLAKIIGET